MEKRAAGALLPLALTAVVVWALSLLPAMDGRGLGPRDGVAVFLGEKPEVLSDANLVDWLAALPRDMALKHAEWDGRMLLVDFQADMEQLSGNRLYVALSDVAIAALAGTENVRRLRVRVFDPYGAAGHERWLVAALDAGREAFEAGAYEAWLNRELDPETWLNRHFRLTGPGR